MGVRLLIAVCMVVRMHVIMTMIVGMAVTIMAMAVPVTGQAPDQKPNAREDEHYTDELTLLRLNLMPELQPDCRNNRTEDHGCSDMTGGSERTDTSNAKHTPPLRTANHCKGDPVIGQDGMEEANQPASKNEQKNVHMCSTFDNGSVYTGRIAGFGRQRACCKNWRQGTVDVTRNDGL